MQAMKKIIIGIIMLLFGVSFCFILTHQKNSSKKKSIYDRPTLSFPLAFCGYLIPLSMIIITAGTGDILSKRQKKKRIYYKTRS